MNSTREKLAANAHDAWARWTRHLLGKCRENSDGSLIIPSENAARWKRLLDAPYDELTEQEKASDRAEADVILNILHTSEHPIKTD